MDRVEIDRLVGRLVADPHDEEALHYAHQAGESDPKAYASLLERVGNESTDPEYAAHWLNEAARVWETIGDLHRAARMLMLAIEKDPRQHAAADRLGQLYREKGDMKALVALLDRRAKALQQFVAETPEVTTDIAAMHEEMGRLWSEPPLASPRKAIDAFKKAIELDPASAFAIYSLRELYKSQNQWRDAIPLYAAELELEQDPERRLGLLRDEAQAHKAAGDLAQCTQVLERARELDPASPELQQEYASSVLERQQAGSPIESGERTRATRLLVGLAEQYEGEHGFAYAGAALDLSPGDDHAIELFSSFARAHGQETEITSRYDAYLRASPRGSKAKDVRLALASTYEAAGNFQEAVAVLEPLRAEGDPIATAKLFELGPLAQSASIEIPILAPPKASPSDEPDPFEALEMRASKFPPKASAAPVPLAPHTAPLLPNSADSSGPHTSASSPGTQARPAAAREDSAPRSVRPPPGAARDDIDASLESLSKGPKRPLNSAQMQGVLDAAQLLSSKGKKTEAYAKYKEVLDTAADHPEALAWTEDYLRGKRDYSTLRDVLLSAVRASHSQDTIETRKERLREVAGLCEGNLRDPDGAISAWKQLLAMDRKDETARTALTRLLEKSQRWDDLANLLEQEATIESDFEQKIALEKKLAKLQEDKRKDPIAAGEAWMRICALTPEDEFAIQTAAKLFERGERPDMAANVLAEMIPALEDPVAKGPLLQRLAELREQLGEFVRAGDAFADSADMLKNGRLWEEAERLYTTAEAWDKAANAATQRGQLTSDAKQQASYLYRAADYLQRIGDGNAALQRIEEASDLDPVNDDYATALVVRYTANDQVDKLVAHLAKRGDRLFDKTKRIAVRREAAQLASTRLPDRELARDLWLKLLEDGDDREALERLVDEAAAREDHTEAATLLRRLGAGVADKAERARIALREAEILSDGVGDVDTAVARYEWILSELDPTCRPALQAIADIQEARDNLADAADALERELKLVADVEERGQIAARLARLYESLDDPRNAIRALDLVRKANPEDLDALNRLSELCEQTEQWSRLGELLAERIEVEADPEEASQLTMKLARVLADNLDRGDEALGTLTELADEGDAEVRAAYIELGDRLGWKGIVASKLVEWWFDARHGVERTSALKSAFERFVEVGHDQDAVRVAIELVRTKGADSALASKLEELSVKTGDVDALVVAHELLAREVSGAERAVELVRQAEIRAKAGMSRADAVQHGEAGLGTVSPSDAEPLLDRLAQIANKPTDVIDLYERQVSRSKAPQDRMRALARAAQIAATRGAPDRARAFFELALTGAPSDETLQMLEQAAKEGDRFSGGDKLRRALANAMASGGHGARDGGRTRGSLLRRAAHIAHVDLKDIDQSFAWLADALVAHVEASTLDALEALGVEVGDPRRSEAALTHALNEVFDGPLVRQLLGRRAKIRRELIVDHAGAAQDLKKLHDLSPQDHAVMEELSSLLTELSDFRSLVHVYEDQILRGKDVNVRAELARKVARIWEEQLQDAREAADAWRRVLRMKAADEEATQGLDRAKKQDLRQPDPASLKEWYAPPKPGEAPKAEPAPKQELPKLDKRPALGTPKRRPIPEATPSGSIPVSFDSSAELKADDPTANGADAGDANGGTNVPAPAASEPGSIVTGTGELPIASMIAGIVAPDDADSTAVGADSPLAATSDSASARNKSEPPPLPGGSTTPGARKRKSAPPPLPPLRSQAPSKPNLPPPATRSARPRMESVDFEIARSLEKLEVGEGGEPSDITAEKPADDRLLRDSLDTAETDRGNELATKSGSIAPATDRAAAKGEIPIVESTREPAVPAALPSREELEENDIIETTNVTHIAGEAKERQSDNVLIADDIAEDAESEHDLGRHDEEDNTSQTVRPLNER